MLVSLLLRYSSVCVFLVPSWVSTVLLSVCWAVIVSQIFCCFLFVCCLSFFAVFFSLLSIVRRSCLPCRLCPLMRSLYPSRKRWDLDLSSSRYLVNPGWLSPSCSNQDPFSPVCVHESVCLLSAVVVGGMLSGGSCDQCAVCNQSIHSLISRPMLKHTLSKPVSVLGVHVFAIIHCTMNFLRVHHWS